MPKLTQPEGLPASEHMERTILGAMLQYPAALADAITALQASDFSLDSNQRIFRAMLSLHTDGEHVDSSTVRERLLKRRELDSVGGFAYVLNLEDGVPRNFNVQSYCNVVKEKARLRELYSIHAEGQVDAADPSEDAQTLIERTTSRLRELLDEQTHDIQHVGAYLASQGEPETIFETLATVGGVPFGFASLDEIIGGVQGGELIIVAARPSMGKTAWCCNVSHAITQRGRVAALFPLEQKRKDMIRRMLASAAKVDYKSVKDNTLSPGEKLKLLSQRESLATLSLYIDDTPKPTVTKIKAKCLRLQRQVGLDIVLVDQLSKVAKSDVYERGMGKHEWVGAQTTALKLMAQELNVPVVVFNQLGRDIGKRSDPTPKLEDLKESGSIEEDADIVILLHRPEYYDKQDETLRGKAQMIVAKSREGATGTVECTYQGRIMRWSDSGEYDQRVLY